MKKKWYVYRNQWENDRKKLIVSDDDADWSKDADGNLNSFWNKTTQVGWIIE